MKCKTLTWKNDGLKVNSNWVNPETKQTYDAKRFTLPGHLVFELSNYIGTNGISNASDMEEALIFLVAQAMALDCDECLGIHRSLHPTHVATIETD